MLRFTALLCFLLPPMALAELPPKELLHVGQKPYLLEDDRLGTIPEDVWEKNIMGRGTRFGLVPYRRGLYGGANFDSLEIYGNGYLGSRDGKPKSPWLMKIVIKDECLKPASVTDLRSDEQWVGWLASNVNYLVRNASFWLNPGAVNCDEVIVGTQPVSNGREENMCDDVMQKFMAEKNPRVVRDTEWPESWYIRDRACIEKLESKPADVLSILADSAWDAKSRESTHSGTSGGYGMSAMAMLFSALADSPGADPAVLARIREKSAASDIRLHFNGEPRRWVKEAGPALVSAFERCRKADRHEEFRRAEKEFADRLASPPFAMPDQEKAVDWLAAKLPSLCS